VENLPDLVRLGERFIVSSERRSCTMAARLNYHGAVPLGFDAANPSWMAADVGSQWRFRKAQRASTSSLGQSPSQGSLVQSASMGSLQSVRSFSMLPPPGTVPPPTVKPRYLPGPPPRTGNSMAPPHTPMSVNVRSTDALYSAQRNAQRAKFDQLASWLERQDGELGTKLAAFRPPPPKKKLAPLKGSASAASLGSAAGAPTEPAQPAVREKSEMEKAVDRAKLKSSSFVKGASDALNSRFSDMFKAFQYVDLDRSGTTTHGSTRQPHLTLPHHTMRHNVHACALLSLWRVPCACVWYRHARREGDHPCPRFATADRTQALA
jgi:hypothetical protein